MADIIQAETAVDAGGLTPGSLYTLLSMGSHQLICFLLLQVSFPRVQYIPCYLRGHRFARMTTGCPYRGIASHHIIVYCPFKQAPKNTCKFGPDSVLTTFTRSSLDHAAQYGYRKSRFVIDASRSRNPIAYDGMGRARPDGPFDECTARTPQIFLRVLPYPESPRCHYHPTCLKSL